MSASEMSIRATARLAWSVWGISICAAAAGFVFVWLSRHTPTPFVGPFRGFEGIVGAATVSAGVPIAARRPTHPIGWLFLVLGASFCLQALGLQYAHFAILDRQVPLPGGVTAAWAQEVVSASLTFGPLALVLQLFPTGRFLSHRWRIVGVLAVSSGVLDGLSAAFKSGPIFTFSVVDNPYALTGAAERAVSIAGAVGATFWVVAIIGGAASIVVRFRRSTGVERQQVKWVAMAAALVGVGVVGFALTLEAAMSPWARLAQIYFAATIAAVPVAAGMAMLRYRLYDIDRIISRTVAYAAVTGLLGATYAGLVFLLGFVVRPVGAGNDLAVAGSVLAVAALFRPVRRRVQSGIDRRFDRARYDAARTIEAFSARMRDEIDIDAQGIELREIVTQTMEPSHVSLWLRR